MPSIARLTQRISKSPTIAMNDKAKQLAAEGHSVIGLAGGEPDFDTPEHILEAGIKALRDGETRYSAPSKGIRPLLEAIADKMQRDNRVRVDPMTDIIVTPGGKLALFLALKAMLDPGDEVLIPAPYWVSYPSITTMVGGVPVTVPTSSDDNYRLRLEHLREFVTPKTKAIIINSPCNPTGHMLSSEEIETIATLATESDLHIISDEIYEKLNFDGRPASVAGVHTRSRGPRCSCQRHVQSICDDRMASGLVGRAQPRHRRGRNVQLADGHSSRHFHAACRGCRAERPTGVCGDYASIISRAT